MKLTEHVMEDIKWDEFKVGDIIRLHRNLIGWHPELYYIKAVSDYGYTYGTFREDVHPTDKIPVVTKNKIIFSHPTYEWKRVILSVPYDPSQEPSDESDI